MMNTGSEMSEGDIVYAEGCWGAIPVRMMWVCNVGIWNG